MHIVTTRRLQQAGEDYKEAESDIASWIKVVKAARWKSFVELKASFPDADDVDGIVVFNIRHNRYRLLAVVHYARVIDQLGRRLAGCDSDAGEDGRHALQERVTLGHVYIGAFVTHKEYERWSGMSRKRREEWLQF